jgi:hypothetical protein
MIAQKVGGNLQPIMGRFAMLETASVSARKRALSALIFCLNSMRIEVRNGEAEDG